MDNKEESAITVKDFQSFLQKCLNCKSLEVIDLEVTRLLPLGENYGSIMLKINATIRKTKDSEREILNYVAKTPNHSEKPIVDWPAIFKKEVFIYTDLLPAYKELEEEMNIKPVIDILPKYIGHRGSLNDNTNVINEHSMLLLENLKSQGYYNCNKRLGMNLEHAQKAFTSLSRYHALGIALRRKRPDFFQTVIAQSQILAIDFNQLDEGFDDVLKIICDNPCFEKHLSLIKESFASIKNGRLYEWRTDEPWITITHGDFWCNNILFHKNQQGHVDDVKFVDFQVYTWNSPLKDLSNFVCHNLDEKTKDNHVDELFDLYYDNFIRCLEKLGCNSKPFGRGAFNRELKQQAINDFPWYALLTKFNVFEINDELNSSTILTEVLTSQSNNEHIIKQLKELIEFFEKRGWF